MSAETGKGNNREKKDDGDGLGCNKTKKVEDVCLVVWSSLRNTLVASEKNRVLVGEASEREKG
jgi:hypothetical protein